MQQTRGNSSSLADDNDIKQQESRNTEFSELPKYWLNVEGVLRHGLPALVIGEKHKQTVSRPGTIKLYFHGDLCRWKNFHEEVSQFWDDGKTVNELLRCANLPVSPDPSIERLNSCATTVERLQCGSEITVSGRFFSNALDPVIRCVETLATVSDRLPPKVIFGDSWIQDSDVRVTGQYPDIIGKLQIGTKEEVRLVGEIKFPRTVNIALMLEEALREISISFRAVLGQIVNYMLGHRLKYAFLTNNKDTTCLKLEHILDGQGQKIPRVVFSATIGFDDTVDKDRVSVRLALFYLLFKTFSPHEDDWRISEETMDLTNNIQWINSKRPPIKTLDTPFGDESRRHPNVRSPSIAFQDSGALAARQARDAVRQQQFADISHSLGMEDEALASPSALETPSKISKVPIPRPMAFLDSLDDIESSQWHTAFASSRTTLKERFRAEAGRRNDETALVDTTDGLADVCLTDEDGRSGSSSSKEHQKL